MTSSLPSHIVCWSAPSSCRHSETFVPVCLPNFQPNAFLHAYIANLEPQQQQAQQHTDPQQQGHVPGQQQQQQHGRRHLHYDKSNSIFLLLLSGSADSFHKLSSAKQVLAAALGGVAGGVLDRAAAGDRGRLRVKSLPAPLGKQAGCHVVAMFGARKSWCRIDSDPCSVQVAVCKHLPLWGKMLTAPDRHVAGCCSVATD